MMLGLHISRETIYLMKKWFLQQGHIITGGVVVAFFTEKENSDRSTLSPTVFLHILIKDQLKLVRKSREK